MKSSRDSVHDHDANKGFTLIELLVTMVILSVLAAMAAPSFSEAFKRYRVNAVRDDLMASIQWARSEAIRRRMPIGLVRTSACGVALTGPSDWGCGWDAFVDGDTSVIAANVPNGVWDAASEPPIRRFTVPTGTLVNHNVPVASAVLIINRFGQPTTAFERFTVAPPEGITAPATKTVCFFPGGSIRTRLGTPLCNATF